MKVIQDTVTVLLVGFVFGALSSWFFMRFGFGLGARKLYEEKKDLSPGERAVEFEQSVTEDEDAA